MYKTAFLVMIVISIFFVFNQAIADIVIIQGTNSVTDTWLNQAEYSENYGQETSLFVRKDVDPGEDDDRDTLIKFNLSSIPDNAVITSAKLSLYYYDEWYMGSNDWLDVSVFSMKASWDEGSGGSGTERTGASWKYRYAYPNNSVWAQDGARGSSDRGSVLATVRLDDAVGRWVDWQAQALTAIVGQWYAGTLVNNGLVLDYTNSDDEENGVTFWSSEVSLSQYGPKLEVGYYIIPEPTTLLLFGLGGLVLHKRRA